MKGQTTYFFLHVDDGGTRAGFFHPTMKTEIPKIFKHYTILVGFVRYFTRGNGCKDLKLMGDI